MTTLPDLLYVAFFAVAGPVIDYAAFWPAFRRRSQADPSRARRWLWGWVVDPSGTFMTKAERLARLMAPAAATPLEHVQIKRYGDVYVRRFLTSGVWVLDIWVHEPAGWRVVAVQATPATK